MMSDIYMIYILLTIVISAMVELCNAFKKLNNCPIMPQ